MEAAAAFCCKRKFSSHPSKLGVCLRVLCEGFDQVTACINASVWKKKQHLYLHLTSQTTLGCVFSLALCVWY